MKKFKLKVALCFVQEKIQAQMKTAHLSQIPPNMSSIGAVCDNFGKTSLTSLVGNFWATDGLRVNSSQVMGECIIFPLFLLEEIAILPMTARADCVLISLQYIYLFY